MVTLRGYWNDLEVTAEVVYGDIIGDPEVAMDEIDPYAEDVCVYSPCGDEISWAFTEYALEKIAEKLIEEAKE